MSAESKTNVSDNAEQADFKLKYKTLKRKLKGLVYEHELLTEQLEKSQKKLLRVSRDRTFLLDRMLQYEKVADSSSDSDATDISDSDTEKPASKKKTLTPTNSQSQSSTSAAAAGKSTEDNAEPSSSKKSSKSKPSKKSSKSATNTGLANIKQESDLQYPTDILVSLSHTSGLSRQSGKQKSGSASRPAPSVSMEELEKHLDSRPTLPSIEKATTSMPTDIFGNIDSEGTSDNELDAGLVIDVK